MTVTSYEEMLNTTGFLVWKTVGVSMRPLIREGQDTVIIQKRGEGRCKKYDVVLFIRPNTEGRGQYVLHRILKVLPDGTYWIVGDNCLGGEIVREENILGVLTAVNRRGKKLAVTDFRYRAYVRLWCAPYPIRFFILRYKHYPRAAVRKLLKILGLKKSR